MLHTFATTIAHKGSRYASGSHSGLVAKCGAATKQLLCKCGIVNVPTITHAECLPPATLRHHTGNGTTR